MQTLPILLQGYWGILLCAHEDIAKNPRKDCLACWCTSYLPPAQNVPQCMSPLVSQAPGNPGGAAQGRRRAWKHRKVGYPAGPRPIWSMALPTAAMRTSSSTSSANLQEGYNMFLFLVLTNLVMCPCPRPPCAPPAPRRRQTCRVQDILFSLLPLWSMTWPMAVMRIYSSMSCANAATSQHSVLLEGLSLSAAPPQRLRLTAAPVFGCMPRESFCHKNCSSGQ